jgi:two-component system response regulator MprA
MTAEKKKIYKILVVDDESGIREFLSDLLIFLGYQPIMAADGSEALEIITHNKPDMIITDINMPRMDGIELLKAVKREDANIPVLLISGYKINGDNKALVDTMANGFLSKPFDIDQIKTLITNLLPC